MIGILTLGAIALGLAGASKHISAIGATKRSKRRIYSEVADMQREMEEDGDWNFSYKWDELPTDRKSIVEDIARVEIRKGVWKPSASSSKSAGEQYWNQLRKAYNAISGVGHMDDTIYDIAEFIGDIEFGGSDRIKLLIKQFNDAIRDMERGMSLYDANVGVYDIIAYGITDYCNEQGKDLQTYLTDKNIETLLYILRDNAYNALEDIEANYSSDFYSVHGVGATNLLYRTSTIYNDRGDLIMEYRDYGSDKKLLSDASMWLEYNFSSAFDLAVLYIAQGGKFIWSAKKPMRGVKEEVFATSADTNAERKARISYLSKDGVTPEGLAHSIWEAHQDANTPYFLQDTTDILNGVCEALRTIESTGMAQQMVLDAYIDAHKAQDAPQQDYLPF